MISTAHPTKDTVSIGARGLGGMSYFLHVFWDTEIFVLPFFIYTQPETARTLLKYRYRNLPGRGRRRAQMGFRGALYPWESADKGVETTPPYGYGPSGEQVPILSGLMEHHISADVAWGTWEYWKATGDDAFMAGMGVEMHAGDGAVLGLARGARPRGPLPRARRRGPGRVPRGRGRQRLHQRPRALEHQARHRGARLAGDGGRRVRRRAQEAPRAHGHRALRLAQGHRRLRGRLRPGDAALRAVRRVLRHGRRADREAAAAADGRGPAARPRRHASSARWSSRPTS